VPVRVPNKEIRGLATDPSCHPPGEQKHDLHDALNVGHGGFSLSLSRKKEVHDFFVDFRVLLVDDADSLASVVCIVAGNERGLGQSPDPSVVKSRSGRSGWQKYRGKAKPGTPRWPSGAHNWDSHNEARPTGKVRAKAKAKTKAKAKAKAKAKRQR